jgi:hypothetical protein
MGHELRGVVLTMTDRAAGAWQQPVPARPRASNKKNSKKPERN